MGEDSNNQTCTTRISKLAAMEIESFRRAIEQEEKRRVSFVEASRRVFETSVRGDMPIDQALKRAGNWKIGKLGRKI